MVNDKRYYMCKVCGRKFDELKEDKKCAICGGDMKLVQKIKSDNAEEKEKITDIK